METVEKHGVLPSFFPAELKIDMNSPKEVALFIAKLMKTDDKFQETKIFELIGPEKYNAVEVAAHLSKKLTKNIKLEPIPSEKWKATLLSSGFTDDTSENLIKMTQSVVDRKVDLEYEDQATQLPTTFNQYLMDSLG